MSADRFWVRCGTLHPLPLLKACYFVWIHFFSMRKSAGNTLNYYTGIFNIIYNNVIIRSKYITQSIEKLI